MLAVADAWGLERFDLVGHDWGAMVAWVVAGRHPERVRTLTRGVGAPPAPSPPPSVAPVVRRAGGTAAGRRPGPALVVHRASSGQAGVAERALLGEDGSGQGLRAMFADSGLSSDTDEVDRFVAAMLEPGALTAALNWYRAMEPRAIERRRPITVPTLYVWSTRTSPSGAPRRRRRAGGCRARTASRSSTGSATGSPRRRRPS